MFLRSVSPSLWISSMSACLTWLFAALAAILQRSSKTDGTASGHTPVIECIFPVVLQNHRQRYRWLPVSIKLNFQCHNCSWPFPAERRSEHRNPSKNLVAMVPKALRTQVPCLWCFRCFWWHWLCTWPWCFRMYDLLNLEPRAGICYYCTIQKIFTRGGNAHCQWFMWTFQWNRVPEASGTLLYQFRSW